MFPLPGWETMRWASHGWLAMSLSFSEKTWQPSLAYGVPWRNRECYDCYIISILNTSHPLFIRRVYISTCTAVSEQTLHLPSEIYPKWLASDVSQTWVTGTILFPENFHSAPNHCIGICNWHRDGYFRCGPVVGRTFQPCCDHITGHLEGIPMEKGSRVGLLILTDGPVLIHCSQGLLSPRLLVHCKHLCLWHILFGYSSKSSLACFAVYLQVRLWLAALSPANQCIGAQYRTTFYVRMPSTQFLHSLRGY